MGITLVTPAQFEPITLDEALAQCRVTQDTENGLVAGYIITARTFVEKVTRLTLMQQVFDYTVDFNWPVMQITSYPYYVPYTSWRTRIELPKSPVKDVSYIQYLDNDGLLQTLDPTQYVLVLDDVVAYVEPVFGVTWPVPRYQPATIKMRLVCGFGSSQSDVPENLRQAMLMLITFWYDNRGSAQFQLRVTGAVQPPEFPPGIEALLSVDRLVRIL